MYKALEDAASQAGFILEPDESFHQASVDSKATAFIWEKLNQESMPEPITMDLVLRDDVYSLLEESSEDEGISDGNENVPF